jgi:hypothetical protein
VLRRHIYFSQRLVAAAAVLVLLASTGCATFQRENWSLNRLRDERAVDIESRLTSPKPVVDNPF